MHASIVRLRIPTAFIATHALMMIDDHEGAPPSAFGKAYTQGPSSWGRVLRG